MKASTCRVSFRSFVNFGVAGASGPECRSGRESRPCQCRAECAGVRQADRAPSSGSPSLSPLAAAARAGGKLHYAVMRYSAVRRSARACGPDDNPPHRRAVGSERRVWQRREVVCERHASSDRREAARAVLRRFEDPQLTNNLSLDPTVSQFWEGAGQARPDLQAGQHGSRLLVETAWTGSHTPVAPRAFHARIRAAAHRSRTSPPPASWPRSPGTCSATNRATPTSDRRSPASSSAGSSYAAAPRR
jgi:hypothetical protein